jgi:hypothetical protein
MIVYKRTKSYVKNTYVVKDRETKKPLMKNGKQVTAVAHGLVGELWIHGLMFETIERMDGYMHMKGDKTYTNSTVGWHDNYESFVINPWLGKKEEEKKFNILFHPGGVASHVEGCIAVGVFNAKGVLEDGKYCLDVIREQAGGASVSKTKSLIVAVKVEGDMPPLTNCKPWVYQG